MNSLEKFGKNVKTLRKAKRISQETFAEKINLHRTNITRIEKGYGFVEFETLEKIAQTLDVTIADLFNFEVYENPKSAEQIKEEINALLDKMDAKTLKVYLNCLKASTKI